MSPNVNHIIAGKRAQSVGREFEGHLKKLFNRAGWLCIHFPSGMRRVGPGGRKIVPIRSRFDFVAIKNGQTILFDAKTTKAAKLPPNICKEHQSDTLSACLAYGVPAGFIVWFSSLGVIRFYSPDLSESIEIGGYLDIAPWMIIDWYKKSQSP